MPILPPVTPASADMRDPRAWLTHDPAVTRVLMSDSLKETLPDLETDANEKAVEELEDKVIHVLLRFREDDDWVVSGENEGELVNGILVGLLHGSPMKVDVRVMIDDALNRIKKRGTLDFVELLYGVSTELKLGGPWKVAEVGISDVTPSGTCTMMLTCHAI